MVALGLIASPRPSGNTATAVRDVLAGLELGGTSGEELFLPAEKILPIDDCQACIAAGGCGLEDDFDWVMERVYAADLLVVGTPLYWYGPSGQLKLFLDRWSCLLDREEEVFRARMRGKRAAIVVAQGERGFYEAAPCLQMLEWTFRYLDMPTVGRIVVVGHARGDYAADADQRQAVRETATRMSSAEATDLTPPWFHLRYTPGDELGGAFTP